MKLQLYFKEITYIYTLRDYKKIDEYKDEMLAIVSRDLKSPVSNISIIIE